MQLHVQNEKDFSFLLSGEGITKVMAIVAVLTSCIMFLSISTCQAKGSWDPTAFPITTALCSILILFFYVTLSTKLIEKYYKILYLVDVITTTAMFVVLLVISALKITHCRDQSVLSVIPGCFAIMGALSLGVNVAIAVTRLKRRKDINKCNNQVIDSTNVYRKSIVV